MKICSKCGIKKSLMEFNNEKSSKDGKGCWCKECIRIYDRLRNMKPEIRARAAERRSNPDVIEKNRIARIKYESKPESKIKKQAYDTLHKAIPEVKIRISLYDAKRNTRPEVKAKHAESSKRYRSAYPEKKKAHRNVEHAIKSGMIIRPTTCAICGSTDNVQYHHDDYSKPLDVIPLCSSGNNCHGKRHRQLNSIEKVTINAISHQTIP